jgi:ABC-type lipoprotein export system ATPase subunit
VSAAESILQFAGVSLAPGPDYDAALRDVSFELPAGRLVLVRAEAVLRLALADGAEGLVLPVQGEIAYLGQPWGARRPDDAAACRGRIGRTFAASGWLNNLDVDENITLKQRHHTRLPASEVQQAALDLARRLGFDDLPHARPAWTDRAELQRAQWVRALLGAPGLLLLEFPEAGVPDKFLESLKKAVRERLEAGAAALWITADARVWADDGLNPCGKYQILDGRWARA